MSGWGNLGPKAPPVEPQPEPGASAAEEAERARMHSGPGPNHCLFWEMPEPLVPGRPMRGCSCLVGRYTPRFMAGAERCFRMDGQITFSHAAKVWLPRAFPAGVALSGS